jgi:hypothetical protein
MLYPVVMSTPSKPADAPLPTNTNSALEQKPKCFVIIQIGKDGSPERQKSDRVLKYIIAKALDDKYDIQRANDIKQPGTVTVQIIQQLLEAPLVVADLSDFNANVYYELAIRHVVKKPVVHLITKGQEAPFDVNQMRYVSYDITAPESIEAAQQELKENVEAIERGVGMVTPIQFTQLVLAAQSGQGGNSDTGVILNAVGTAMSNISEELKNIKELVAAGTPKPFPGSVFVDPNWRGKTALLSDLMTGNLRADLIPADKTNVIARARARVSPQKEKAEKDKTKG